MSDAVVCGLNREDEDVTSSLMKVLWPSSEDSVENSDNRPASSGPICDSVFNEAVTGEHLAAGALDYQARVEQDV